MPRPPGTWERDGVLLKWGAVQRESRMGLRGVLLTRGGPCAAEASHAAGSRAAWGRGVLKGQAGIRACSGPWLRLWRGLGLGPPRHRQSWAAPDRAEARCPERAREVEVSCEVLPIPEFLVQQDLGQVPGVCIFLQVQRYWCCRQGPTPSPLLRGWGELGGS